MRPVSTQAPLAHYQWGDGCDAWSLNDDPHLSVKQERVPPGASEVMHYHIKSRQFFFILKGTATIETDNATFLLQAGEGLTIPPGTRHRIFNTGEQATEFLVCAQPAVGDDRVNDPHITATAT